MTFVTNSVLHCMNLFQDKAQDDSVNASDGLKSQPEVDKQEGELITGWGVNCGKHDCGQPHDQCAESL